MKWFVIVGLGLFLVILSFLFKGIVQDWSKGNKDVGGDSLE